jgi:uncharacterized membrane protein YgcG
MDTDTIITILVIVFLCFAFFSIVRATSAPKRKRNKFARKSRYSDRINDLAINDSERVEHWSNQPAHHKHHISPLQDIPHHSGHHHDGGISSHHSSSDFGGGNFGGGGHHGH